MFFPRSGIAAARLRAARRATRPAAGMTESLESRTLLSSQPAGVVVGVTPGSTAAGLELAAITDRDGGAEIVHSYGTALAIAPGPLARVAAVPRPAATGAFHIVLEKGPNLLADPEASAAFDQAAAFYQSIFFDPITVVIDAEIAPLGANELGETQSVIFGDTFDTIRDRMAADADPASEAFLSRLPNEGAFDGTLPDGSFSLNGMAATRANLLALGASADELAGPVSKYDPGVHRDAAMTFSSDYPFDYNRSDGIAPGKYDFVGVAIHEIGHSLGFVSSVDQVDFYMGQGGSHAVAPTPLDLFRLQPGEGASNFATGSRVLSPTGGDQVTYDGGIFNPSGLSMGGLARGDIPMSTGTGNGDGQQASHWKDDQLIGGHSVTIGIMDPTAASGTQLNWTAADLRAFGLIGWDVAPPVVPAGVSGTVFEDTNENGSFEPEAGEFGIRGVTVYNDVNGNGQFESGLADRFAPAVDLPKDIRDLRTVDSRITVDDLPGVVRDVNVHVTIQHPFTFDLDATLISPSGRQVLLFSDVGDIDFFGRSEDFTGTVLDDEAGTAIENGSPPFPGAYRPMESLGAMDGDSMNGTWTLRVEDVAPGDEGQLIDWGLTFDTGGGEPSAVTDDGGNYSLDLPPGPVHLRQVVPEGYHQTLPAGNRGYDVTVAAGQRVVCDFGDAQGVPASTVVARDVFYNGSKFDDNGGGNGGPGSGPNQASGSDDHGGAIATDKQALLPGQAATSANYTSYSRGINGIIIDVSGLPGGDGPTGDDFSFKVGNDADVAAWADAPVAPDVSVRRGAGAGGSDRVVLTWPDGAVARQWLRVTVKSSAATGLANPDVFYFGNLPGETVNAAGTARVTALDAIAVRGHVGTGRAVTDHFDFNRDGRVNAVDYALARANVGRSLFMLSAGDTQAGAEGAPPAALFGQVPVTEARTPYRPARVWDETPADPLA